MPGPNRLRYVADAFRAGLAARRGAPAVAHRSLVPGADRGPRARGAARRRAGRRRRSTRPRLRTLKRKGFADSRLAQLCGATEQAVRERRHGARHPARVQARRYLRRGVRDLDRLPVLDLRGGVRGGADRPAQDRDPRRRAEPHRPGHRVRLLLRARGARAARGRVRDHHGQLQPGDGLDRLRHLGPPVLRAADVRGRDGDHARRAAVRRDRAVRRPDAAQAAPGARAPRACRSSARARTRSTSPRTASASRSSSTGCSCRQPPNRTARTEDEAVRLAARDRLSRWWCGRPTCSAAARWRSSSPRTTCAAT